MHRFALTLVLSFAVLSAAPAVGSAAGVAYPDADWTEAWISSTDGVTLHADVLRPKGSTDADKTPVILSIGPYFNHSGQTGPAGPAEDTQYDPVGPNAGPSERFQDFVEGSGLLKKGYIVRDGRPARVRRLEWLPGLVRVRASRPTSSTPSSGRRASRGPPARSACTASPTTGSPG